jgi:hypothetical protein
MQINKPEFNLSNKDIQGSSPKSQFWTTRKPFNPLEPNYNLSQVENVPLPEPKFIRDNIQINVYIYMICRILKELILKNLSFGTNEI